MRKKPDRRVLRTRTMLKKALMELLVERGYDDVDVQDITDRANLGRATFYLHYKNKEELLIESLVEAANEITQQIEQLPIEYWSLTNEAPILLIFNHAEANENLYRIILRGQGGLVISRWFHEYIATHTRQFLEKQVNMLKLKPLLPLDFIGNYFAGSLLSLVSWWLENDRPYPKEEMVKMFLTITIQGRARATGLES
jgi:AcrR family transcriptional regulator